MRIGDIAAALAILGLALFGAYVAFVVFALRCDESCFDPGQSERHWSDYQDSWQWSVMGAFAVIGLLGAFALVARAASDGVAAARWEIGVTFLAWAVWISFLVDLLYPAHARSRPGPSRRFDEFLSHR